MNLSSINDRRNKKVEWIDNRSQKRMVIDKALCYVGQ